MSEILERRLIRSPDAATSKVADETVILHLGNGTYYGLDRVGTRIFEMLVDDIPIPVICRILADEYRVELATIEGDAVKFVIELEAEGIVVDG